MTRTTAVRRAGLLMLALALAGGPGARPALAAGPDTVLLEELTSPELRERIAAGATTVLVPVGGTEQNGPHMVLGKHNRRVALLAQRIARELGRSVVAPVMAYVPEGGIEPPQAHMRFAGTISIPEPAFEAVLAGAARSFRHHGFRDIVLLGDHGGYQASLQRVAAKLNREWGGAAQVHVPPEYYRASVDGFAEWLAGRGYAKAEIGSHAGLSDTALALAVDPALVRRDRLDAAAQGGLREGVGGDPRRANADLGQAGLQRIVESSVAALRARIPSR